MTEDEELIADLLRLVNGGIFPGKGKRANELIIRGNNRLGAEVGKLRRIVGEPMPTWKNEDG